ncbi:MAG: aldose epimerase [Pseudanabaenaceae cyanobacterium SKYGB_i_bin29]|nr:aldose epimerase [Pseudanabaenaceae cyanobacterium SKYG29]MDW8420641.1 aldose epimerase [Pseudanabaenaceae cyanobacterium SKYGB_i_bin29]
MYSVGQQEGTWVLQAEGDRATVLPERGGILLSWAVGAMEILYLDRERFANPALSIRGGIPLLFPICGNLVDDTYTWEGQSYKLPQHGFARHLPWTVTNQNTAEGASITVTLSHRGETLAVYPFPFQLDYTYTLRPQELELQFRHTNLGTAPMPFATGIHPYFLAPDKTQLQFQIPAQQYVVKGETQPQAFTGEFDFDCGEIDIALMPLSAQVAKVTDRARNLEVTISYDQHYTTLVFWTVKGKDFYCLEPWSSPRNALNTGEKLITLASGESLTTSVQIAVKFL